jgi:S1-C subfamily serine protease
MKYLITLLIPIVTYGQDLSTVRTIKHTFLDSNFHEVRVINPNKLSFNERKQIHYYDEYYFDNDAYLIGRNIFYAKGKTPYFSTNSFGSISHRKEEILAFNNAEKREGKVRTRYEFSPTLIDIKQFENFLAENTYTVTRFFPNGVINHKTKFEGDKVLGNKQEFYSKNGKKEFEWFYDEKLNKIYSIKEYKDEYIYINNYSNYKNQDYNSYTQELYSKKSGIRLAKFYYVNGQEQIDKRQYFSQSGNEIFYPSEDRGNKNEEALREYFIKNSSQSIEGVYTIKSNKNNTNYRIALLEDFNGKFYGYQIDAYCYNAENWESWERRVVIEKTSIDGFYDITWYSDYKEPEVNDIIEFKGDVLTNFGDYTMLKLYPKSKSNKPKANTKNDDWVGNGSGILISKSGYIVTNQHVIEDANAIEVEFISKGELNKLKAEIIQSDKINDLAIIKITDMNFSGIDNLSYNFKSQSSDVGTKVYAYGYPMALSIMGKEIKITDGIISSKTGYDGDITTYQITAPIQPGNSGGPLFDSKGNFIGINSSGLNNDISENVGYTIKSSYVINLIDVLPESFNLPSSTKLQFLSLTEQIKEISKYVVLIKVK